MIRPENYKGALFAIHWIMVIGRLMAYQNEDHKRIANLLDYGEMLPRFMVSEEDETDTFRKYLANIAQKFPVCSQALRAFDEGAPPGSW